ncbi:30S ribosomal protein S12 methylthiotransferase RimO [Acanthopleuribacter pedis]|uniref:Ribosomal protein uS12 methylthiotransferase RimO n=1 Tax=Acanthopleuribacter pedis TaxID=442870 RepID=A0A8J7U533_9BACT|nr:30S ribosomal protein S12 methylthiotransferase RimO [Acanthopleuribacter pedis]MBO1322113.1 30S ribosomal protein S12 methylthiotransferase RimO [Acanthopleuribacter pedis]
MKKVGMLSLGCAKNLVDSEVMLGELAREGYALTNDASDAEVVIVNTCGFIESAKEESIAAILDMAEMKKQGKLKKLIVSGCLSQRYHTDMAADLPEVDLFLGINHVGSIRKFLEDLRSEQGQPAEAAQPEDWRPDFLYSSEHTRVLTTPKHSAYVKISEGCDHVCSFCIIPNLRGKHRSRTIEDIVAEVEQLGAQGVREINLVAQDSTYYGRDIGLKDGLAQLMEAVANVDSIDWVRAHYMYPYQVTDRLLALMARHPKVCKYMDIPLQHCDREVLAAMKRGSGRPQLAKFLDRIREAVPDVWIRTSFIVGFPGEDERAFDELCGFVGEQQFDYIGVFTYSHEEDTTAHPLGDPVSEEEKMRRKEHLLALQKEISREKLTRQVGQTFDVLIEGVHPETELLLRGRHQGQAPDVDGEIFVTEGFYQPGDMVAITIEETFDYDMAGRATGGVAV